MWYTETGKDSDVILSSRVRLARNLKGIPFPGRADEEAQQKVIVSEIESRLSVCDSIEKTVDTALQQAEAMRQSILKKAFEGRI